MMKRIRFLALGLVLLLMLTACGPIDRSALGGNLTASDDAVVVYEDDNSGESIQPPVPTPNWE